MKEDCIKTLMDLYKDLEIYMLKISMTKAQYNNI